MKTDTEQNKELAVAHSFSFLSFIFADFHISLLECSILFFVTDLSWHENKLVRLHAYLLILYMLCTTCALDPLKRCQTDFLDGKPILVSPSFSLPRKCDLLGHSCAFLFYLESIAFLGLNFHNAALTLWRKL